MVKDYTDESIISYSALKHMRSKSSMYGFQVGALHGNLLQIKEVIDNSVDEAIDPDRIYPIRVTLFVAKNRKTYQVLVQDFGRGVPPNKIVDVFTKEFTSGKYDEVAESYQNSTTGTNGIGSKVVAALSNSFSAFTKRMDGFGYLKVEKGVIKDSKVVYRPPDRHQETDGTTVLFQPDDSILTATSTFFGSDEEGYNRLIESLAYRTLFKRNVKFIVRRVEGMIPRDKFVDSLQDVWRYLTDFDNLGGSIVFESDLSITPRSYVISKFELKEPIWDLSVPLYKPSDPATPEDRLSYDIDIFLDERSAQGENGIIGAVNTTPINDQNSIHFTMLQNVIKMYLDGYVLDKEKQTFLNNKYIIPFSGCVSVGWKGAGFDGQDKSKFSDTLFGDFYRSHLRRHLNKLPESIWERLYELILDHFEMSYAKYTKTQYKMKGTLKGIGYTLKRAGAYVPCKSSDNTLIELYITEGDSAAGRLKAVRDSEFQAYYKLSGKPINAERADSKKLIKNLIYQDLTELTGVRPTDTDLSNMRFSKIIFLSDADADGYHIIALLIGIIKTINKLILEDSRVYIGNPPLYSLNIQRVARPLYLRDQSALLSIKTEIYRRLIDIYLQYGDAKEVTITGQQYQALCAVVEMIGDRVTFIADQLNTDPFILEQLLHCVDYLDETNVDTAKIEETLKDAGIDRVVWDKVANTVTLITQGLDLVVPLSHLQSTMRDSILPLYEKYDWKKLNLSVTTRFTDLYVHTPCSFMMLYHIFKSITDTDNSKHFAIQRFKGLGEMEEEDIDGTCVNPVTRSISRICGIGDLNIIYNMLGVDSEARKQLTTESVRGRLVNNGFLEE